MGMRAVSNPRRGLCTSGLLSQESFNKVQRLFSLTCLKHPMASLGFKIKHPILTHTGLSPGIFDIIQATQMVTS